MQLHFRREVQRGNQVDREAMRSEAGRQALQLLFATVPDIPWATPVDDHVCQLNRHLQSGIRDLFPAQPQRPRKPTISERTWALLHAKRQQRRCHRRRKTMFAKWFLAQCFQAWRGAAGPGHIRAKVKTFDQVAATHMRQMRELTTAARQAQKEDDAAFVRQMFREAKAQGPVAIAQQVRAVLRSGRNAKIARPTIALDTAEGRITEPAQVQAAFASHFGQAEAATQRPVQDICRRPLAPVQGVVAAGAFNRKYVGLLRGAVRPLYGVPCRRLTDDQVCALLSVTTAQETYDIAVLRVWACMAVKGDGYLRGCAQDSCWRTGARAALVRVASTLQHPALVSCAATDQGTEDMFRQPSLGPAKLKALLRRYRRHLLNQPSARHALMIVRSRMV